MWDWEKPVTHSHWLLNLNLFHFWLIVPVPWSLIITPQHFVLFFTPLIYKLSECKTLCINLSLIHQYIWNDCLIVVYASEMKKKNPHLNVFDEITKVHCAI